MDHNEHIDNLVLEVQNTAAWRARKAGEYPEDDRNERSSRALSALADSINALPTDHRLLQSLADINQAMSGLTDRMQMLGRESAVVDDVWARISEDQSSLLRRFGFDDPNQDGSDVEAFLSDLCDMTRACVDEAMANYLGASAGGGDSIH